MTIYISFGINLVSSILIYPTMVAILNFQSAQKGRGILMTCYQCYLYLFPKVCHVSLIYDFLACLLKFMAIILTSFQQSDWNKYTMTLY
jgi:hypothetical protein